MQNKTWTIGEYGTPTVTQNKLRTEVIVFRKSDFLVWCSLWSRGVIELYFFRLDHRKVVNINSENQICITDFFSLAITDFELANHKAGNVTNFSIYSMGRIAEKEYFYILVGIQHGHRDHVFDAVWFSVGLSEKPNNCRHG